MGDFSDESLEGELSDEQISALLVFSDLSKSDSAGSESVGLLDASGGGGTLAGCLGCQLLSWGLGSSGFSGGLLGSGHFEVGWGVVWVGFVMVFDNENGSGRNYIAAEEMS